MRDKKTGLVDDLNDLKAFAEAMRPGELTVISGASGVGKTTLALRIAQELVGSDEANEEANAKRVLVFSPKHPSTFFVERGLCRRRIYIDDYERPDALFCGGCGDLPPSQCRYRQGFILHKPQGGAFNCLRRRNTKWIMRKLHD